MASKTTSSSSAKKKKTATNSRQISWGLVAAVSALVLFVVGVIGFAVASGGKGVTDPTAARIENLRSQTYPAGQHTAGIDDKVSYKVNPPDGGEHNGLWQNCGVYTQPIQDGKAVHSLEHGAVWITYQPSLPAAQIAALAKDYVDGQDYMMISPHEQANPITVSAWGRQVDVTDPSDPRIKTFIDGYRNGPSTPERGALCNNGVGSPTDRQATVNPQYAQLQQGAPAPAESGTPAPAASSTPAPAAS